MILGVVDEAIRTAKQQLAPKADALRPYEQVEWARAERHWLAVQAYEGRAPGRGVGDQPRSLYATLRGKEAVAELAESSLGRLVRVLGGGAPRRSPFASWFEDVRALGFLRPPWGLAYDSLFLASLASRASTATGRPSRTERQAARPATSAARPSRPSTGEGPPLSTIDAKSSHSAR